MIIRSNDKDTVWILYPMSISGSIYLSICVLIALAGGYVFLSTTGSSPAHYTVAGVVCLFSLLFAFIIGKLLVFARKLHRAQDKIVLVSYGLLGKQEILLPSPSEKPQLLLKEEISNVGDNNTKKQMFSITIEGKRVRRHHVFSSKHWEHMRRLITQLGLLYERPFTDTTQAAELDGRNYSVYPHSNLRTLVEKKENPYPKPQNSQWRGTSDHTLGYWNYTIPTLKVPLVINVLLLSGFFGTGYMLGRYLYLYGFNWHYLDTILGTAFFFALSIKALYHVGRYEWSEEKLELHPFELVYRCSLFGIPLRNVRIPREEVLDIAIAPQKYYSSRGTTWFDLLNQESIVIFGRDKNIWLGKTLRKDEKLRIIYAVAQAL